MAVSVPLAQAPIVLDELHALVTFERGYLLSLGLALLVGVGLRPRCARDRLSATVAEPEKIAALFLLAQRGAAQAKPPNRCRRRCTPAPTRPEMLDNYARRFELGRTYRAPRTR